MSIRGQMINLSLSIIIHYCLTKMFDLMFIGCHNFRLEFYCMVVTTSVQASVPSRLSYHVHYVNSDLRCHFIMDGYGIFTYLRRTISYPRNISAYEL